MSFYDIDNGVNQRDTRYQIEHAGGQCYLRRGTSRYKMDRLPMSEATKADVTNTK